MIQLIVRCVYELDGGLPCGDMAAFVLDNEFVGKGGKKEKSTFGYCSEHWQLVKNYYKRNKTVRRQTSSIEARPNGFTVGDALAVRQ